MPKNILRKFHDPAVDQSLEATRSIEFQLLNMKNELEKFPVDKKTEIDLTPAVSHTLETLQQIDIQLKNMSSLLEDYSNQFKTKDGKADLGESIPDKRPPNPPPFPPTSPPTFPPTYPSVKDYSSEPYPPTSPYTYPPTYPTAREHYPPPFMNPYYPSPFYYNPFMGPYPAPMYGMPPQFPPMFSPYYPSFYPPPEGYPTGQDDQHIRYYESAKYPTVASSEPAYSSRSHAVPSQVFKIAYYPWEQLTGKRSPMSSRVPYINLYDLGKEYLVYVELPGVEKDNIEIRVDEQSVWINGKPTIIGGEDGTPIVQEHGFHEFSRQLILPSTIIQNKTSCDFENGILKIILIKDVPKKSSFRVKIK